MVDHYATFTDSVITQCGLVVRHTPFNLVGSSGTQLESQTVQSIISNSFIAAIQELKRDYFENFVMAKTDISLTYLGFMWLPTNHVKHTKGSWDATIFQTIHL